jgi:hypothetical protein
MICFCQVVYKKYLSLIFAFLIFAYLLERIVLHILFICFLQGFALADFADCINSKISAAVFAENCQILKGSYPF